MGNKHFTEQSMIKKIGTGERIVADMNTVIHCHHYNARLQKTIEGADVIDGESIIRSCSDAAFTKQLESALRTGQNTGEKLALAGELYSYLGFGRLNFDNTSNNVILSDSSHFVEGWKVGYESANRNVCTFTEGFLQAALRVASGENFEVRETECMYQGAENCRFELRKKDCPVLQYDILSSAVSKPVQVSTADTAGVDMEGIRDAVFSMPLVGNNEGLVPAFNVYLANMPKDYYNLISLNFINEMRRQGFAEVAYSLLYEDAETCALNAFAGIMNSDEWATLVQPMIADPQDNIFALTAVENALGWGVISIVEHKPGELLKIATSNCYEAEKIRVNGEVLSSDCPMLSGVSSGMMALVYITGNYESRVGAYSTKETKCISMGEKSCEFEVIRAKERAEEDDGGQAA